MAKLVYENADVALSLDGGSTFAYNLECLLSTVSLDIEAEEGDGKTFCSEGWNETTLGGRSFSGSLEGYIDTAILTFANMLAIIESVNGAVIRVRPQGTGSSLEQILLPCRVTGESMEFNTDETGSLSFDFSGNGKPDFTPQPA